MPGKEVASAVDVHGLDDVGDNLAVSAATNDSSQSKVTYKVIVSGLCTSSNRSGRLSGLFGKAVNGVDIVQLLRAS